MAVGAIGTEFIGLVPPSQTMRRLAPREWLRSYVEPEPVEIEFLDGADRHWNRRIQVVSVNGVNGLLFPHARQVLRIQRKRRRLGTTKW